MIFIVTVDRSLLPQWNFSEMEEKSLSSRQHFNGFIFRVFYYSSVNLRRYWIPIFDGDDSMTPQKGEKTDFFLSLGQTLFTSRESDGGMKANWWLISVYHSFEKKSFCYDFLLPEKRFMRKKVIAKRALLCAMDEA
jgi:hypothetical protein